MQIRTNGRGFSLIEMAVVLAIFGLLVGMVIPVASTLQEQHRRSETQSKMALADQALLSFAMANRRLPCPADGALASGAALAGQEQRLASGDCVVAVQTNGVLPWATIGLSENDATDAWNLRLTYRVPSGLFGVTHDGALDATQCDVAGTAAVTVVAGHAICAAACTRAGGPASCTSFAGSAGIAGYLFGRGLAVQDENGVALAHPWQGTGAAYVLISHGRYGGGGYNSAGVMPANDVAAGANEGLNINGTPIRMPVMPAPLTNAPAPAYFHDSRFFDDRGGAIHYDDLVSHPTVATIISKAQLSPREPI